MKTLTKRPFQVYLRPDQRVALQDLASKLKVSVAELIRRSVDEYLAKHREGELAESDPAWRIIGLGKSGIGDVAARHNDYILPLTNTF